MKKKLIIAGSITISIIIIVTIFLVYVMSGTRINRKDFKIIDNKWDNWEDVFNNPQDITVEVFNTGSMPVPIEGTINIEHENAKGLEKKSIVVEVPVFLIKHEKKGYYLIDTGLDSSFQNNPYGILKGILVKKIAPDIRQKKDEYISAVLNKRNIKLNGVFFTHLHFDHIAGVYDLPKNIKYVAGKGEVYMNIKLFFEGNHLKGIEALEEIDFSQGFKMEPFDKCIDIFGDGSLIAVNTNGHTKGHTSFFVNGRENKYFISGDACFHRMSLERNLGPGFYSSDIEKSQEVIEIIKSFSEKYPEVKMLFGHEIEK